MLHWLIHAYFALTGAAYEPGKAYGFWSGFGGTVLFSAVIMSPVWWWHHTCHDSARCLRLGRYPAAGGVFRLCARHHPDFGGEKPRRELIHRMHREHLERLAK
jgi:hypothetical protein